MSLPWDEIKAFNQKSPDLGFGRGCGSGGCFYRYSTKDGRKQSSLTKNFDFRAWDHDKNNYHHFFVHSPKLEQETHLHTWSNLSNCMAQYVSKAGTDPTWQIRWSCLERGRHLSKVTQMESSLARTWFLVFCGQIQYSFYYVIGHSDLIFGFWNWPHLPPGSISTNSYNKRGCCWSESRALGWHPTANAILLSHRPHRNRWGENAEYSSSCSCGPDPHELWCSKGKMKR